MKHWFLFIFLVGIAAVVAVGIHLSDEEENFGPGLEVYTGEGCIHCHSQYRRPVELDRSMWGPATDYAREMEEEKPVLFGNRRQGPDLSNVGLRRSREWNRIHLMDPRAVRTGSRMPSYAYLFDGDGKRGEALLDYLADLGYDDRETWLHFRSTWEPVVSLDRGDPANGASLFQMNCAACHGVSGRGDGPVASSFSTPPRNLAERGTWRWVQDNGMEADLELARLIKFGQPGTSMSGTEWLSDGEIADLVRFIGARKKDWP